MQKTKFLIFFLFIISFSPIKAQIINQINVCEGDTVYLTLQNYHGTTVWQYSSDTIDWEMDTININDTIAVIAINDIFYRALIYEGTCDTIYSGISSIRVYPSPTIAQAGTDQLNLPGISVNLSGNEALVGQGSWHILSGTGGHLNDSTLYNTQFSGIGAHAYTLVWKIENECKTTIDTVLISFRLPQIQCGGTLYVHPTDNHGGAVWGCQGTTTNATSTSNGEQNTTLINSACSDLTIAAKKCSELTAYGYSDWYLPASDELNCLYLERNNIGGFYTMSGIVYWSSTETSASWAASQNFNNGQQVNINQKQGACRVRCVRRD
ncbi:MAG: DUF1566 domain-containing protein [Bacteroidales bacterium]|nr:DUF1566 domain-containing protein [Bacteroidales bacterium]